MIVAPRFTSNLADPVRATQDVRGELYLALAGVINDRLPLSATVKRNDWGNWVIRVRRLSSAIGETLQTDVPLPMSLLMRLGVSEFNDALNTLVTQVRETQDALQTRHLHVLHMLTNETDHSCPECGR